MKSYQEVTNFWYATHPGCSVFFTCMLSAIPNISSLSTGCSSRITKLQVITYGMSLPSNTCVYVWCVYVCVCVAVHVLVHISHCSKWE